MSIINKINPTYPYPVLISGSNSYQSGEFNVDLKIDTNDIDVVTFKMEMTLTEDKLLEFIETGQAVYAFQLECNNTGYRQVFTTNQNKLTVPIQKIYLLKNVELGVFVVAQKDIINYKNSNFNVDYVFINPEGEPLIEEGSVLAVGLCKKMAIDIDRQLEKKPSFFNIVCNEDSDDDMFTMNLRSDPIQIILPKKLYSEVYQYNETNKKSFVDNSIALPALLQAISYLQIKYLKANSSSDSQGDEILFETRWEESLINRLMKINQIKDMTIEEFILEIFTKVHAVEMAQQLLKSPLGKILTSLKKF